MPFNTATVGTAIAPIVIQTFFNHYLNRKPLAQKPTAHISYDEGLHLIRKFLLYASNHTVEDIQRFTAQWVPCPTWVLVDQIPIPQEHITAAAGAITKQLGPHGVQRVGGENWWQWRRPGSDLRAEWIEMRSDAQERKANNEKCKRVMMYVHGGAYFFGSTDEHRYQIQRHARKLKARVLAPRYRLAPQFPFPCGLHDCLSAYLFLLSVQDPTTIILAGDSAGGGMVTSLLVTLRDQGLPLPAGAILISPWVDLTHSFPSVSADCPLDYIPSHGFHQKPSASWPPPNSDDMLAIEEGIVKKMAHKDHGLHPQEKEEDAVQGFHVASNPDLTTEGSSATRVGSAPPPTANNGPGRDGNLSITIDEKLVEIKDQIQMYASNHLITHPLVSPILQPSLGGLPPLLILTGGGEMLADEQIYLAHKAANPVKYAPGDAFLDEHPHDHARDQINKWKPTDVQLQVWDDMCHVGVTLSFTRPAKHMYRSVSQFGAWALARAQKTEIEIMDDDDISVISESESETESDNDVKEDVRKKSVSQPTGKIGRAGDTLPAFKNHMIRQRVDRHGNIFNLEPASELVACNIPASEIGVIKPGPVRKWMAAKREWDRKFATSKRKVQKRRAREIAEGYEQFAGGDVPPPSALAGRRKRGSDLTEKRHKKSMGMSLWSLWGSKHDEKAKVLEDKLDKVPETVITSSFDGKGARPLGDTKTVEGKKLEIDDVKSRSRSRRRTVVDQNQTGSMVFPPLPVPNENTSAADLLALKNASMKDPLLPDFAKKEQPEIRINGPHEEYDLKRPKADGIAFPFTVKGHQQTASMTTLTSSVGVPPADNVLHNGALESGVTSGSDPIITSEKAAMKWKTSNEDGVDEDDDKTPMPSPGLEEKVIASGQVFPPGERPPYGELRDGREPFDVKEFRREVSCKKVVV